MTWALTSELGGKQQCLQQRVEVAGASLVLDAAQITFSSWRRRLLGPFYSSSLGGNGRAFFFLLLLKKIAKHAVKAVPFSVLSDDLAWSCCLVALGALLLSHLGLSEFSVDNGRTHSEIRRLHGTEHSEYYRM